MYNFSRLFLIFIIIFLVSCRENNKSVTTSETKTTDKQTIEQFHKPVVLLIYPDLQIANSLKKAMGDDAYYELSDKNSTYFHELRTILKHRGIAVMTGENKFFRFYSSNGAITEINLASLESPWQVIIFNGTEGPLLVSPEKAKSRLSSLFPFIETKTSPGKSISLKERLIFEYDSTSDKIIRDPDFIRPDRPYDKEITIRLLIPPGQKPVADRQETAGIRIINSFISPAHRFWLNFDNDIFSNTDRYYTNGIEMGYSGPNLVNMPLNFLILSFNRNSVVQASLSLHHAMFTPFTTKTPPLLRDERPYASTLFIRYSQTSDDAISGLKLTSSIDAGVIGDAALGRYFQKSVHATVPTNDEPLGWETQIRNDLVLNYSVNLQKQLLKNKNTEVYAHGEATLGTLHTRAGMGINAIAGLFIPGITRLPMDYSDLQKVQRDWQYGIRGGFEFRLIGYDATLQGGIFSNENIYSLKPEEIERMVAAMHLGVFARHRKLGISISQYYLSPEFKEGKQHFWGQIGLDYNW
ncbi:MAG: lipid A deacylase LpxR family protein [Lentimicrobium sp.]|nr:lipid A deacylase LpxR family protein [Lentimicrobium sp.]